MKKQGDKKMTKAMNPYDALYTNLKNQFTAIYNGTECTVGDFMLMKANQQSESNLPIVASTAKTVTMAAIVEYVNDKLTVKKAPVKDKTMKTFPFRTSLSAMLSATAACALVFSCGILALNGNGSYNLAAENQNDTHIESIESVEVMPEEIPFEIEK